MEARSVEKMSIIDMMIVPLVRECVALISCLGRKNGCEGKEQRYSFQLQTSYIERHPNGMFDSLQPDLKQIITLTILSKNLHPIPTILVPNRRQKDHQKDACA